MADAAVWITGTGQNKQLNFRLPTGGKGDKGDKGDKGADGSNVLPTDTAIAAAVNGNGATRTALNATYVPRGEKVRSIKDGGAIGDGVADDTAAIQAVINASAAETRATSMGIRGVVEIPAGKYKITDTIIHPPYVKVVCLGAVLIESYCPAKPAWWIAPLASDPTNLYAPLKKQQWLRGHILDGSRGGMTFLNRTGTPGTTIGLETGTRSNLNHQMARYGITDVAIQDYDLGLQFNTYNHYITWYSRMHLEQNNNCVKFGISGVGNSNSGENINFNDSLFGTTLGSGAALIFESEAIDVTLRGCSVDFVNTVARFNSGWNRLLISGGHLEGINEGTRRTATGGIAVSNVTGSNIYPDVVLQGMVPFVQKERGTQFRGNMRLWLEMEYRNNGDFTLMSVDDGWLCNDSVVVRRHSMTTPSGGPTISRNLNGVIDSDVAAEASGTAVASLANYTVASVSNTVGTVSDLGPRAGSKSIKAKITGSGYLQLAPKAYINCQAGDVMAASMSYMFTGTPYPTLTVTGKFFNSEKVQIKTTDTQLVRQTTVAGAWRVTDGPATWIAPPGAAYFRPSFQVSTGAGDGVADYHISDFNGYKA